jgi:hypothetical protein
VHVGYEPSAVLGAHRKLGDNWKMLKWQLSGKMGGARWRKPNGKGQVPPGNGAQNEGPAGHPNGGNRSGVAGGPGQSDLVSVDGSLRVL